MRNLPPLRYFRYIALVDNSVCAITVARQLGGPR
jgi:hypothetical protein